METKIKYAPPLALLFALTILLIIQPLAANPKGNAWSFPTVETRAIDFGQTIEGTLGDGKDDIWFGPTKHPGDAHKFNAQAGQSYIITVTSPNFRVASRVVEITKTDPSGGFTYAALQQAEVFTVGSQVQYSGTLENDGEHRIFIFDRDPAIKGQYTLTLESYTPPSSNTPSAGVWRGSLVAFNVSEDGSKITHEGSNLLNNNGEPKAIKIGPIVGSGGCKNFKLTVWYTGNVPIVNASFKASSTQELTLNGTFTSQTTSEGQISADYDGGSGCSGNFQKSGSWKAQKSSSARINLPTKATISPAYVDYDYNETGEITAIKVYEQIGGED